MKITNELLKKYDACKSSLARFNLTFPNGIEIPSKIKKITVKTPEFSDIRWLLDLNLFKNVIIRLEDSNGSWETYEYDDDKGGITRHEKSNGSWETYEYDDKGDITRHEKSNGCWKNYEYDDKGNITRREYSYGYWRIWEYDDKGNITFSKDSDDWWKKFTYENDKLISISASNRMKTQKYEMDMSFE